MKNKKNYISFLDIDDDDDNDFKLNEFKIRDLPLESLMILAEEPKLVYEFRSSYVEHKGELSNNILFSFKYSVVIGFKNKKSRFFLFNEKYQFIHLLLNEKINIHESYENIITNLDNKGYAEIIGNLTEGGLVTLDFSKNNMYGKLNV